MFYGDLELQKKENNNIFYKNKDGIVVKRDIGKCSKYVSDKKKSLSDLYGEITKDVAPLIESIIAEKHEKDIEVSSKIAILVEDYGLSTDELDYVMGKVLNSTMKKAEDRKEELLEEIFKDKEFDTLREQAMLCRKVYSDVKLSLQNSFYKKVLEKIDRMDVDNIALAMGNLRASDIRSIS